MKAQLEVDFIHLLIPGYRHLPAPFVKSLMKKPLGALIKKTLAELNQSWQQALAEYRSKSSSWASIILLVLTSLKPDFEIMAEENRFKQNFIDFIFKNYQANFLECVRNDTDYQRLRRKIDRAVLEKTFPAMLNGLLPKEIYQLAKTDFSQDFIQQMLVSEPMSPKSKALVKTFVEAFKQWPKYPVFQSAMAARGQQFDNEEKIYLDYIDNELDNFFPLSAKSKDKTHDGLIASNHYSNIEQDFAERVFTGLNQASKTLRFIDLTPFHYNLYLPMAQAMLENFKQQKAWSDAVMTIYKEELYAWLLHSLKLVNNHAWQVQDKAINQKALSLLYKMLVNNQLTGTVTDYVDKLAEAHSFMQATAFCSQNDNEVFAALDYWNLFRNHKQIAESKGILTSLAKPFLPIYEEYQNIARFEKSHFRKVLRSLMPIVVVVAVILLCFLALGPLGLPEVALAAALIPAFFIGLGVSVLYLHLKDSLYLRLRSSYYGGVYEIPEFQVNPKMVAAFHSNTLANDVRNYYLEKLKACDALEQAFQSYPALTQSEQAQREENQRLRTLIALEWYDIHTNEHLGFDQIPPIVLARLKADGDGVYQDLLQTLSKEAQPLKDMVSAFGDMIEENLQATSPDLEKTKTPDWSNRFFSPVNTLNNREKLTRIDTLINAIPKISV